MVEQSRLGTKTRYLIEHDPRDDPAQPVAPAKPAGPSRFQSGIVGPVRLRSAFADSMKWLRTLFGTTDEGPVPKMVDRDFGRITYDGEDSGIWQSDEKRRIDAQHAEYGFSAIPGDRSGPYPWARAFLVEKSQDLQRIWEISTPTLEEVCERWTAKGLRKPVFDEFALTSIGMSEDFQSSGQWDAGFESKGRFWVYVEIRVVGDKVEGHTCDT